MLSMEKRAEMFEAKLSQYDLVTLSYICKRDVQNEVDKTVDKKVFAINQAIETCIAAALFDSGESTIAEVEVVIKRINEYMKENEEFLIEYKEDWIMKINEIKQQIKEECLKILDKGTSAHNDALKDLKKVFPKIPNKDLINIFQEAKEEYQENDEAIKEIADEIANEITTQNQPILEQKEVSNVITPKKQNKSVEKQIGKQKQDIKSIFEVVEKTIKLKTPNGTYEKTKNGIKFNERLYKDIEEVKAHKKEILDRDEERKIKIIKEIEKLQDELSGLDENEKIVKIRTEEVIAAFAYEG
ncbi:hypothetical protein [Clostridium beijerinckii]|uniref:hypothetical protein n=1 Tax=Clostridium beijerinckii TaxID=1520 RepID=UPI00047D92CA|nr:hypothetical protein [Clostridium beijerinckii]